MRIAVLSGKGGTGKTFVATSLAAVASQGVYLDCDVEEPNGHLFFQPQFIARQEVEVPVPQVDHSKCTGCRRCVEFCRFKALAYVGQLLIFEEMCHSCGGCTLFCPEQALSEKPRVIGKIEQGWSEDTLVCSGFLNPGEESGVPIIAQMIKECLKGQTIVIDSPPGSSCNVMESVATADYCLLVAESTAFGIHNLTTVSELVTLFQKPHGVIINKTMGQDHLVEAYCQERDIHIIGSIPFDKEVGKALSKGTLVVRDNTHYRRVFQEYLETITREVALHETVARA